MSKPGRRPVAVFHFRKNLSTATFILRVRSVILMMGQNPLLYNNPMPPLNEVAARVVELEAAEARAKTRIRGAAAARDVIFKAVRADVFSLLNYVQRLADLATPIDKGLVLIANSGFHLKRRSACIKPPLRIRHGQLSGTVLVIARGAGKRDFHDWDISYNGTTWTHYSSTTSATLEASGLKPLATVYFRHRVITKDGPGHWDNPLSIVVL